MEDEMDNGVNVKDWIGRKWNGKMKEENKK